MKRSKIFGWAMLSVFFVSMGFTGTSAWAWDWPKHLTIGTPGLGTATYAQTVGWGSVMEKKTGMKVRVHPTNSYAEHSRAHKAGEHVLGNNTITEYIAQMEATGNNATKDGGPYETGIVWFGQGVPFGYIMLNDCDIKTLADLKKKNWKVSLFTPSTTSVKHVKGLLAWAGVDEKDVTYVPATSWTANTKSVVDGRADISFSCPVATVAHEVEANPKGIRWLNFPEDDKAGMERYIEKIRGIGFERNFKGVKSANGIYTIANVTYYHTRLDTDPELVYQVAKWLGENYDGYKDTHKSCEDMTLAKFKDILDRNRSYYYFPIHAGVVRYLKEKGQWSPADDAWNEKNKLLIKKLIKAHTAALAEAKKRGIKVQPKNEAWLNLWADYNKELLLLGTKQI